MLAGPALADPGTPTPPPVQGEGVQGAGVRPPGGNAPLPDAASGVGGDTEPTVARPAPANAANEASPSVLRYTVDQAPPSSVQGVPTAPSRLTLRDALLASFERSGEVSSSRAVVESALAAVDAASAKRLPVLDAFVRSGVVRSGQDRQTFDQTEVGFSLSATLFDWGAGSERVESQRALADGAASRLNAAVDTLGFSVIDSYYDVLLQRDTLRVVQWALTEGRKFEQQLKAPVEAGAVPASLAANAAALVAQQEAAVTSTIRTLRQSEAQLAVLVGMKPGDLVDPRVFGRPFGTVDHAVALAIARSPDVKEAQARTRSAEAARRALLADDRGRLTLDAQASIGRNAGGNADASVDGSIAATYRIPIFDGGLRDAQAAGASGDVADAGGKEVAARHQVETAVRRAWAVHETAATLRREEERAVDALERALKGFPAELQAGQRQPSELPTLIGQSADAQKALATYYYGEQLAVLHLYRHTGDAFSVLGVERARAELVKVAARDGSLLPLWLHGLMERLGGG